MHKLLIEEFPEYGIAVIGDESINDVIGNLYYPINYQNWPNLQSMNTIQEVVWDDHDPVKYQ